MIYSYEYLQFIKRMSDAIFNVSKNSNCINDMFLRSDNKI